MFSASVASGLFSAVNSILAPKPAAAPASQPGTQPTGSTKSNNPTGTTNPFQSLSADLQSWLTQNQASGEAGMHHHHSSGGQQQAGQTSADPTATTATATA